MNDSEPVSILMSISICATLVRSTLSLNKRSTNMRQTLSVMVLVLVASNCSAFVQANPLTLVWADGIGGASNDVARAVSVDTIGNIYVVGNFAGTVDFDPGPGVFNLTSAGLDDGFVSKLDTSGKLIWAKRLGGATNDAVSELVLDNAGGVFIVGYFTGTADFDPGPGILNLSALGFVDAFVLNLDGAGNLVWAKQIGGTGTTIGSGIAIDKTSGDVLTTGQFGGNPGDTVDFDPGLGTHYLSSAGNSDAYVLKLSSSGSFLWARRFGGTTGDRGGFVAVDDNGAVYTAGGYSGIVDFDPGPNTYNLFSGGAFISKLDSSGNFVWANGLPVNSGQGAGVELDAASNVYVTGQFYGTSDFDPGPGIYSLSSAGNADGYITKFDSSGNFHWALAIGGTGNDYESPVALDASGNVYAVGGFSATVDFDPGPGTYYLTSAGATDAFVSKFDSSGSLVWAERFGSTSGDGAARLMVDADGNIYMTGSFHDTVDFDPSANTFSLNATGAYDVFILRLQNCVPSPTGAETYGMLIFAGQCTHDASLLSGDPNAPYYYNGQAVSVLRNPNDRFYLSSTSDGFTPLIVDDAVAIDLAGTGLGPYSIQPGRPPFEIGRPIEENLVPEPAYEVTGFLPMGHSTVQFDLLDTQREIYGNTAVFLVQDCGISRVEGASPTEIEFLSHDDSVVGDPTQFDVAYGLLSDFRAGIGFAASMCLGVFADTPAIDTMGDPPLGDGYYYLARGRNSCGVQGYGDSSLTPDPRDLLDTSSPCH